MLTKIFKHVYIQVYMQDFIIALLFVLHANELTIIIDECKTV